jgi:Cys-rich protein (TIGR01571 family)
VLYGQNATTVNGGDCVSHGLKFYLYSCCCACGLVSGPTRRAIRDKYELPVAPAFLKDQGANADCLTGTIPCVACFALCQDARELAYRAPGAPIDPRDFDWAPVPAAPVAPAETAAPAQAEMAK